MKHKNFLKSFLNFKTLSLIFYMIALFSNIFLAIDNSGLAPKRGYLGVEGILFGWFISRSAMLPWLSNLIYWYLILFGNYFNFLRIALSVIMICLAYQIFDVNQLSIPAMMDTWNYDLSPENGIYFWLISYILLLIHFIIGDWKLYRNT